MSVIQAPTDTPDSFRNKVSSIGDEGVRNWIYPKKPSGKFYNARTVVSWFLLAFLFGAPFIKVNGHPFMLFNILERKFVFFGLVFFPQDFYLVVLGLLTCLVSIFLFSAIFGRIWCGWLCPQTVFLEMLFRKIEYFIDGDSIKAKKAANTPMTPTKLAKKIVKQVIFFALSFLIANMFLSYIIGLDALKQIVIDPPSQHIGGLAAILIFSFIFYGVFAWFREQACIVVCPYGRFQSALVDANTIVVTYDFKRGEPRGKLVKIDPLRKATEPVPARGDCVECKQCVEVCPTGIDIRNGIQLECVNCTACIDACDAVMDKIKKPRGLIRYTSLNAVRDGKFNWLTMRVIGYGCAWLLITSLFLFFFIRRPMTEVLILRQPGTLASKQANGDTVNFYLLQIVNKHDYDVPVEVKLLTPEKGSLTMIGDISNIPKISEKSTRFILALPKDQIATSDMNVKFGIFSNGKLLKELNTRFLATTLN